MKVNMKDKSMNEYLQDDVIVPFIMIIIVACIFVWGITGAVVDTRARKVEREEVMKEAFERGYAVQCLGVEGYFWECEE